MKTGIFYWFGYNVSMAERFKLIASAGFDNVLLWWGDQFTETDGLKEEHPDLARKAGLFVENIHTDFEHAGDIWLDNSRGDDILQRYLKSADDCRIFKIPVMVVHLADGENQPPCSQTGLDRIKRLVDKALNCNITIALENIRKTEYLDFVFEHIQSPVLKLCYDSGHENCYTKKDDVLDKYGHLLCCLHLHDNDGSCDQHMIPGEGNINWQKLIEALRKCNFTGSITLEAYNDFPANYKTYPVERFLIKAHEEAIKLAEQLI